MYFCQHTDCSVCSLSVTDGKKKLRIFEACLVTYKCHEPDLHFCICTSFHLSLFLATSAQVVTCASHLLYDLRHVAQSLEKERLKHISKILLQNLLPWILKSFLAVLQSSWPLYEKFLRKDENKTYKAVINT